MKKYALAAALVALTACSGESRLSASAPPAVEARMVKEENDLLEFTYSWPAEAAAIPALDARLEADMAKQREQALAMAREDKESRPPEAPFHGHYLQKVWTSHGDTPRLLSIAAQIATFTGGAHGNTAFEAILWDRARDRPIEVAELFADPASAFAALSAPYCEALDRQRVEKRGEPLPAEGEDWLIGCPDLAERVIVPVDADENHRFERLRVLIPPYEAGPYAEGKYEVDVPITEAVRGLIKPEYRSLFLPASEARGEGDHP